MMNEKEILDLSVVVPCYNCQATIERAVQSVIEQTSWPKELILVNDASSDETLKILIELKNKYPNLIILENLSSNGGAANARNVGWDLAKGRYIAFLDSDDSWHVEKLRWQYHFMNSCSDIALCGHGHVIADKAPFVANFHHHGKQIGRWELLRKNPFVTPSVMLKKDINMRFRHGRRYMEDYLLWLDISCRQGGVYRLDLPMVTIHKPLIGVSGLSSHVWAMSLADFENYFLLYKSKDLALYELLFVLPWVALKFLRRISLLCIRRIKG